MDLAATDGQARDATGGWSYDATSTTVRHTLGEGREQELGSTPLPKASSLTVTIDSGSVRHTYTYLRK